jgi:hypothetical protein
MKFIDRPGIAPLVRWNTLPLRHSTPLSLTLVPSTANPPGNWNTLETAVSPDSGRGALG